MLRTEVIRPIMRRQIEPKLRLTQMLELADTGIKIGFTMLFTIFKKLNIEKRDIFKVPNQTSKDENYSV